MALNLKLQLRQNQQLIMTPQLQQAIRLLQLSRLELESLVNQALVENPVLEEDENRGEDMESSGLDQGEEGGEAGSSLDSTADGVADGTADGVEDGTADGVEDGTADGVEDGTAENNVDDGGDLIRNEQHEETDRDWQEYIESGSGVIPERSAGKSGEEPQLEAILSRDESLREHLLWQLKMTSWSDAERKLGRQLVGNLDEDGYLVVSLGEILETNIALAGEFEEELKQERLTLSQDGLDLELLWVKHDSKPAGKEGNLRIKPAVALAAEAVLQQVHQWDPVGCGTRNLQECLVAQLKSMGLATHPAIHIIHKDLKLLERRDLNKISSRHKLSLADTIAAWQLITSLEPKPGRPFTESRAVNIIPDVYLFKVNNPVNASDVIGNYRISLNENGIPRLRISEYYRLLYEKSNDSNSLTNQYLQEKIKAGQWLMRSIEQRQKTILKVSQSIVKHQYEFFENGIDNLKPLVLKDIAEDIGVHESTVSRITTNKYMHTPQGLFELKYFFTSGVGQEDGEIISSKKIKDMILKLVNKENHRKPYTDIQIADILNQEFKIKVARRTVAKYREALNVLPSNCRKKLF